MAAPDEPEPAAPATELDEAARAGDDAAARRGVRLFAWVSGAALSLVLLVNAVVNPTGVFPYELLRPLVNPVRARKVRILARQQGVHFDNVVLGSSRTMKLEPAAVSRWLGGETFNAGVNSGRPEDYFVLLSYMLDQGYRPQRVVLGVDVEAFHNSAPVDSRLLGVAPLAGRLRWQDRAPAWAEGLKESLSARTFGHSLRAIRYTLTEYPPAREGTITDHGFEIVRSRDRQIKRGTYDLQAKIDADRGKYLDRFAGYTGVSAWRVGYFERFLELCAAHRITLYVYITPLHPELVALLRAERDYDARHAEVLALLRAYSDSHGFVFKDMSELSMWGGDPANFYDGAHMRVENHRRVMDELLGPALGGVPRGETPEETARRERAERVKAQRARAKQQRERRAAQARAKEDAKEDASARDTNSAREIDGAPARGGEG
ncbi:MAG: hypothetical protein KC468_02265 [Myxococcales bacterium]|nr:hypothetical protein [Myxococcales bacterium]